MHKNEKEIIKLQRQIISSLVPLIQSDYILLDIPNHANIGDQLIYEGELIFLEKYLPNYKCLYSGNCDYFNYTKISQDVTILLHGGGNFGDIYSKHQNFRLDIIKKYPNNRIIVLPQTVYYNDLSVLEEQSKIMCNHNNLFICVRDSISQNILAPYFDKDRLLLLPDMAFFIDFSNYHKKNNSIPKILFMDRVDIETTGNKNNSKIERIKKEGYAVDVKDWPTYYPSFKTNFYRVKNKIRASAFYLFSHIPLLNNLIPNDANNKIMKNYYLNLGVKFMNEYDIVYTTRLHGLILAILLNKNAVILDNNYGKLSSFYKTWLLGFENLEIEDSTN